MRDFSVTVADDGEGHITTSVSGADDLTFTNAYHEPGTPDTPDTPGQNPDGPTDAPDATDGQPEPELPDTGDHSASLPFLGGFAGIGVAVLIAALVVRRHR